MYNPTRNNKSTPRPRSQPPLGSGITRAQIMQKHASPSSIPSGDRTPTPHGYSVKLLATEQFVTRYEVMFQSQSTGFGVNEEADATAFVVRGILYAFVENEGQREMVKLPQGNFIHLRKGSKFGLATGSDEGVELYFTETPDFAKTYKSLEAPVIGQFQAPSFVENDVPKSIRMRDEKSYVHAQTQADNRGRRRQTEGKAPARNANSANVIGVSPRPSGPPAGD